MTSSDRGAASAAPSAAALTVPESARLKDLETIVESGLQGFLEVGEALLEIRAARLYRDTHLTFADYCQDRWGFSDSRGRQLIAAATTVTAVTAVGLPAPKTEGEARRVARALREGLEQHPLVAGLLPDMPPAQWQRFLRSIRTHGLLHPITLFEGKILDGWLRYRACRETGVTPMFEVYDGNEPREVWAALNFMRKDYTEDELRRIAREIGEAE